jgi:serine/threonine-protein kinase
MDSARWQKIESLVQAVLEIPQEKRAAWLDENCDGELRGEVESLLAFEDESESILNKPVVAKAAEILLKDEENFSRKGQHIGQYKILQEIGRGGMGVVYLAAREDEQFRKRVAIKLVKRGLDTEDVLRRFRNERQILASLHHPNIASLLDGGTTEDGLPYFVMEYIEGSPLLDYCDEHQLTTNERLQLFRTICSAVQHAHQNLVIHRDLKPSNILITHDGELKLLDFGVAKFLNPELMGEGLGQTQTQFRVMTPEYASPEQVRGQHITTSTDIYSLGVILYELLAGQRPYKLKDTSPEELIHAICDSEPTKPSEIVSSYSNNKEQKSNRQSAIGNRQLKGDLDNIVLMALRKELSRRYKSVEQFSEDIERHLKGLPVIARKDTFAYRAEKFIQRNRVGVIAASLVLIAVLVGLITTTWQARVAARERDQARQAQAKAEQLNSFLQTILSSASPEEKGRDAKVIEVLNDATQRIDAEFANQPELKAQILLTIGHTYNQLGLLDESEMTLRGALKLNAELYGEENKATVFCMIQLGAVLNNKAKYNEAEKLLSKAVETERKLSPPGSKELALALFGLGELYIRKLEFEKAKSLLQESLSISNKISGEKNEDSAYTLVSLGRAQERLGDLVAAESTYRQSVAIYRQLPSRYEGRMAAALLNLGNLLITRENYDEAVNVMREGDNIFQKQGESFHLFISKTYLCKASFYKSDYETAIGEGKKGIEMGRKFHLEETRDFFLAQNHIGLSLTRTGKAKEGEQYLRESLERARKILSKEDVRIPVIEISLGECLTAQSKFAEAESLIVNAYEIIKAREGEANPNTILARKRAIELYEKWKKPDLANKYRTMLTQNQK